MREQQNGHKPKILIVEDEGLIALDLKTRLIRLGYTVSDQVNTAEKALERIEQEPPDLVLMDIVLKGQMDGIEAADIIRSRWGIPVVFVTAYADHERLERAKLVYPFGYILKPFQDDAIKVAVEMALFVSEVDAQRRKTEETLRQSEERYRTIFENLEDGYYEVDLAGKFTFFNESICRILGYPKEELLGMDNRQYTDQEAAKKEFQIFNKVYRTEEPAKGFDHEVLRKDGTKRTIQASISLRKDALGQTIGFGGLIRDISERKQMEEALRISEERHRVLVEQAPEALLVLDADTNRYLEANASAERLFGCNREELLKSGPHRFYQPIQPDGYAINQSSKIHIEQALAGEEVLFERVIHNAQGREIISEVRLVRLPSAQGRLVRASYIDITARKKMEEALRQSEEKYRTILETIEEGYGEIDLAGNFTFVNDSMSRIYGYLKEELIGMNFRQFFDQENAEATFKVFNQLYLTGEPFRGFEHQIIRKDGTRSYLESSVSLQKDQTGKPVGFKGIVRDITKRKQSEAALKAAKDYAENLIQTANTLIVGLDTQGKITVFNQAAEEITGYTRQEMEGRNWFEILVPKD
ncbi:MAG: hypothetical protein C0407_12205, partial [Desulfobacca sp.]|nr:hypothetical protein [Desulfobacca sp.]